MPAKPRDGHGNRTFLVHLETYEAILEYFSRSAEGLKGAQVIRKILFEYGKLCQERLTSGRAGSMQDIGEISDYVRKYMPKR